MDKIEKIRAEIERQMRYAKNANYPKDSIENERATAIVAVCLELLSSLDILSEEPASGDLEKEFELQFDSLPQEVLDRQSDGGIEFHNKLYAFSRHFAKWGAEHAKKDETPVPNDLEEAAEEQAKSFGYMSHDREFKENVESFIAGAKWKKQRMMKDGNVILAEEDFDAEKEKSMEWGYNLCKEQMLKEAEECELYWDGYFLTIDLNMTALGYSEGDKVRIIIVKED